MCKSGLEDSGTVRNYGGLGFRVELFGVEVISPWYSLRLIDYLSVGQVAHYLDVVWLEYVRYSIPTSSYKVLDRLYSLLYRYLQ